MTRAGATACPLTGTSLEDVLIIVAHLEQSEPALALRLRAMAAQIVLQGPPKEPAAEYRVTTLEGVVPAPDPRIAPGAGVDRLYCAKDAVDARSFLFASAHTFRRTGDGTLDLPKSENPEDDYASACILISGAMQQLDESLPNAQRDRTLSAFAALEYGTAALGRYLTRALSTPV